MPEPALPRRRRPVLLTVVAVLLVLGAVKALFTLVLEREQFRTAFPGSTPALEVVAAFLALCLLGGAVALLAWQRWAVVALVVTAAVTLALDFVARAPWLHTAAGAVLIVLLALAVWPVRQHFAPWRRGAPGTVG